MKASRQVSPSQLLWVAAIWALVLLALSAQDSSGSSERSMSSRGAQNGGSASEQAASGHRERETPMRWRVLSPPWSRKVRIGRTVAWCPGPDKDHLNPPPAIQRVRKVERGRRVILTAFLIHRATRGCLAVATQVERVVTLRHRLDGWSLYDGSVSPPVKRWPKRKCEAGACR